MSSIFTARGFGSTTGLAEGARQPRASVEAE
jgi:hypothetical protein